MGRAVPESCIFRLEVIFMLLCGFQNLSLVVIQGLDVGSVETSEVFVEVPFKLCKR